MPTWGKGQEFDDINDQMKPKNIISGTGNIFKGLFGEEGPLAETSAETGRAGVPSACSWPR